jgi:hypothetical protein
MMQQEQQQQQMNHHHQQMHYSQSTQPNTMSEMSAAPGGPAVEVNINPSGDANIRLYHSYPPTQQSAALTEHPPEPVPSSHQRMQPPPMQQTHLSANVSQAITSPVTTSTYGAG